MMQEQSRGVLSEFQPPRIFKELQQDVVGQDETLRFVSVAVFKHLMEEKFGNLLLVGNSGTGKTTIMKAVEKLYNHYDVLKPYKCVVRVHSHILADDEGRAVPGPVLFRLLEEKARSLLGEGVEASVLQTCMEHATIFVDEADKISGRIADKAFVTGIAIQQALLTLMEGEENVYELHVNDNGKIKKVMVNLDTGKMLFICGGAFEGLYDLVRYRVVVKEKQNLFRAVVRDDNTVEYRDTFNLKEFLKLEDLFEYGMLPQFLSRFDHHIVMRELTAKDLQHIFMETEESVLNLSRGFFRKFNIDLKITDEAVHFVCEEASRKTRIGARALKDVYGRVIKDFEYDPFSKKQTKKLPGSADFELTIDEDLVKQTLQGEESFLASEVAAAFAAKKIRVATAPVNWGDNALHTWIKKVPFQQMLNEMSQAGYEGTEFSESFPVDPQQLLKELQIRKLVLTGAYCALPLSDSSKWEEAAFQVRELAKLLRQMRTRYIIMADSGDDKRRQIAGRVSPDGATGWDEVHWKKVHDFLNALGKELKLASLCATFHPHAGTYVETGDEIKNLMEGTDPELIGLCPDTGHLTYGGAEPLEIFQAYTKRIQYVHFKDVDASVLNQAKKQRLDYLRALREGIFVELGEGCVNFGEIYNLLRAANYEGWIVVEQDTTRLTPLESARLSRRYLREMFSI